MNQQDMTKVIPPAVLEAYNTLESKDFQTFLVGGCVRNMMMGKKVIDWDLTTNATPEQIVSLFPGSFYDNTFGTVGIPVTIDDGEHVIEITTFRTEREYTDRRRPTVVEWGTTIEEDLQRRDFTINAIAIRIKDSSFEIVDPYNGQQDIKDKLIRAVGNPQERFKEDALRLLRAIRFATTLDFTIEDSTWKELCSDASLIQEIAHERVRDELLKILASEKAYEGVLFLKDAGLLAYIIPELLEGIGISQVRPGRHHTSDVFTHNLLSLKYCPSPDPVVRFATLLHDIGKSRVVGSDEDGFVIFHNHEIVGAHVVKQICDRLRFSKKDKDRVYSLIRWHMFTVDEKITDAAVRRFIRRVGVENMQNMIDLRVGDRLGSGTETAEGWRLKLFKKRIEEQLQPAAFSVNDLAIDGHDIMKKLNIKPGPQIGEILQTLFEEVEGDLSKNTKEYLLEQVKQIKSGK